MISLCVLKKLVRPASSPESSKAFFVFLPKFCRINILFIPKKFIMNPLLLLLLSVLEAVRGDLSDLELVGVAKIIRGGASDLLKAKNFKESYPSLLQEISKSQTVIFASPQKQNIKAAIQISRSLFAEELRNKKKNLKVFERGDEKSKLEFFGVRTRSLLGRDFFRPKKVCPFISHLSIRAADYTPAFLETKTFETFLPDAVEATKDLPDPVRAESTFSDLSRVSDRVSLLPSSEANVETARAFAALRALSRISFHGFFGHPVGKSVLHDPPKKMSRALDFSSHDYFRFYANDIIRSIVGSVYKMVDNREKGAEPLKLALYIGQGELIFSLLGLFEMTSEECLREYLARGNFSSPEETSCRHFPPQFEGFAFEVYKKKGNSREYSVRVLYRDEEVRVCPSGPGLCAFGDFVHHIDGLLGTDYDHFCLNGSKIILNLGSQQKKNLRTIFIICVILMLGLTLKKRLPELLMRGERTHFLGPADLMRLGVVSQGGSSTQQDSLKKDENPSELSQAEAKKQQ